MTVRFIHTADWQLGRNFDSVSDNEKRARLRNERFNAIKRIGKLAHETKASFVLVAGDLFDSPTATKGDVLKALSEIGSVGVPVYAIPGNHDHGGPASLWHQDYFKEQAARMAPNFRMLLSPQPIDAGDAWILPCPLLRRSDTADPAEWIRAGEALQSCQDGKPIIVLAHGTIQSFTGDYGDEEGDRGSNNLIELERLPKQLIDYAALGDWHGTKQIHPWAWYSGTHESDRFRKGGDHDPGNVLLVEVDRGGLPKVEKHRTEGIRWHNVHLDLRGDAPLDDFHLQIKELIENRSQEDLIQLELTGSIGLEEMDVLETELQTLEARLLRLKKTSNIQVAPSDQEIASLREGCNDPLIRAVATNLLESLSKGGRDSEIAKIALQELYGKTVRNAAV
jgi:DNA repair exonuclease SbcCD nuclease subunit